MPHAQDIRILDDVCTVQIYGMEVGQFAQNTLGYEKECNRMHLLRLGVDYSWIFLVIGAILFFIGVWAGLGAKGRREILG